MKNVPYYDCTSHTHDVLVDCCGKSLVMHPLVFIPEATVKQMLSFPCVGYWPVDEHCSDAPEALFSILELMFSIYYN